MQNVLILNSRHDFREWLSPKFKKFPPLYQKVRVSNIVFYRKRNIELYEIGLCHLIEEVRQGRMYGYWNDYGRLLEY